MAVDAEVLQAESKRCLSALFEYFWPSMPAEESVCVVSKVGSTSATMRVVYDDGLR